MPKARISPATILFVVASISAALFVTVVWRQIALERWLAPITSTTTSLGLFRSILSGATPDLHVALGAISQFSADSELADPSTLLPLTQRFPLSEISPLIRYSESCKSPPPSVSD